MGFWQFFSIFPWKLWYKKSFLKELKFCEVSRNPKFSLCWKFQLSISLGSKKSLSTIQSGLKLNKSFCNTTRDANSRRFSFPLYNLGWSWTSPFAIQLGMPIPGDFHSSGIRGIKEWQFVIPWGSGKLRSIPQVLGLGSGVWGNFEEYFISDLKSIWNFFL